MNKISKDSLTSRQFMFMLVGSIIATGSLSLPNAVVKQAKQDGWIAVFLGVIYPIYVLVMAGFIQKKFPKENILAINKKCFGKILGTFLNIGLMLYFLLYLTSEIALLSNVLRIIVISFLPQIKVYIVITFIGAYSAYHGLKLLGRVNETVFYIIIFLCILLVIGIFGGSILNIKPIFGSGALKILQSSMGCFFQYEGMEAYLFLYPFITDKGNTQKIALKASFIVAFIYTWLTFVTIYTLGIYIIPKYVISVPVVAKYIQLPVINNFRFIFMGLWSFIGINLISNYYFFVASCLSSMFTKVDRKKICIIMYPAIVFLVTRYINDYIERDFLDFIVPKITALMILYILITVLWIYIKKGKAS